MIVYVDINALDNNTLNLNSRIKITHSKPNH